MPRRYDSLTDAPRDAGGEIRKDDAWVYVGRYPTPVGPVLAAATTKGLHRLTLHADGEYEAGFFAALERTFGEHVYRCPEACADAMTMLGEYLSGAREVFGPHPPNYDLRGTPFQLRVWSELQAIPFGVVASYGDVADKARSESPRAVGQAVGDNPLPVFVPCHRVITAEGTLGGYSEGIDLKVRLLTLEGCTVGTDGKVKAPSTARRAPPPVRPPTDVEAAAARGKGG